MAKLGAGSLDETRAGTAGLGGRILAASLIVAILGSGFFIMRQNDEKSVLLGATLVLACFGSIGFFYLLCSCFGICRLSVRDVRHANFVNIFNKMSQAIVVTDQEGSVRYMNNAYRQLASGKKRRPDVLFSIDENATKIVAKLSNIVRSGGEGYDEISLPLPLSQENHRQSLLYALSVSPAELAGEVIYIWLIDNITQRRHMQERQFADLAQAIDHLDHAPAGFVTWDREGKITYLNATLASWIGFDLASRDLSNTFTLSRLLGAQCATDLQRLTLKNRRLSKASRFTVEIFHESGRRIPVDFHLYAPKMEEEGLGRAVLILSPLKAATTEESVTSPDVATPPFADYFNACPIALASLDEHGGISMYNSHFDALFVLNDNQNEQITKLEDLIELKDTDRLKHWLSQHSFQGSEAVSTFDSSIRVQKLGQKTAKHIRFFIRKLSSVAPSYLLAAVEIDEQRALEQHVEQGQKMQAVGQLAGGIAHDFNNVLTAIIMSCDLLLSHHRHSDPSHPDIMNIKHNADRAAHLVRQLLAFSRRQTLTPEVLDVSAMLADLRLMLARLVGINVQIHIEHGRDLWPIKADRSELERAIINLAINAGDAMPEGGTLSIRTYNVAAHELDRQMVQHLEPSDYVVLEVRDSGCGMSEEVREKIFEPFFTTKEVGRGTGLGLSMVYGMVAQTGGHIHCASELGSGTCFSLYLPRYIQTVSEQEDAQNKTLASSLLRDLSGSAKILVVEDEDGVRRGSVKALQSRGYTVLEASSGVEALNIVRELAGQIDLIVSDVVMPEMDGPTLLKNLSTLYPDIKFIFVSGYAEDAFAKNLPEDAQFAFLAKPFSLKQLALIVKEMLEAT